MDKFQAIIMAAGMGTRMKSKLPKVLHRVCTRPLVTWVREAALEAGADKVVAIVGHGAELVKEELGDTVSYALQAEQKGTGHAVMQAKEYIDGYSYPVVILSGDTPLISADMLKEAVSHHNSNKNSATVITATLANADGYGRIVRAEDGSVLRIVEHKDATEAEREIKEINSGMYVFDAKSLSEALDKLTPNNAQGEYYLTDTLEIILKNGGRIGAYTLSDYDETRGINDRVQLAEAEKIMQKRINERHMRNGVTMILPETTVIAPEVVIGCDTVIGSNVKLCGKTVIAEDCTIGDGSYISDSNVGKGSAVTGSRIINSKIGEGSDVLNSVMTDASVGDRTHVGPFAYMRPKSQVGNDVKVGDFVELKNSNIGNGTKISHLTYIGDSDVGERVNFGCGTVTVNYDGKKKYRTTIEDDSFIGCNTNLVSPVTVGKGAYIAAGSTITDDVKPESLAIARARQVNKENWKDRRK